jgi:N-acetylmuramoyl-L-alanine amidase
MNDVSKKILIALDNGHGLNTPGKRTPKFKDGTKSTYTKKDFMHEWEFNRGVVKRMKPLLERKGFQVIEVSPT